jgi:hypothetical protein
VGRVIAIGPGGKAQAPQRSDWYREVIDAVRDGGMLDQLLLSPACDGREHAEDVRRGLLLSARYYCSCGRKNCTYKHKNYPTEDSPEGGCPFGGQRISGRADVVTVTGEDGSKTWHVQFRLHDKKEAMRSVIQKYGPDPARWPYQSRAKRLKET